MLRGTLLSEGANLRTGAGADLLDMAFAVLMRPLAGHPDKAAEFIRDTLDIPIPGSKAGKVWQAQTVAAAAGLDLTTIARMAAADGERRRKAAEEAATAEREDDGMTEDGEVAE